MSEISLENNKTIQRTISNPLPHIAYVLLWYPLFTQPFIFKEVEGLKKILPLNTYTLYGKNLKHCSEEMIKGETDTKHYGAKSVFSVSFEVIKAFIKQPLKISKLFYKFCIRKWPSLEIFGENLWAFGIGISLSKQFINDRIEFIYAPWPRGAATAAAIAADLANLPYAVAVRGDNLDPADPDLADKMSSACFVRANNAADKKRIENFDSGQARGKTELIYNSLSLPDPKNIKYVERFKTEPLKLFALGRFDVTKGFDILLRACSILKDNNIQFTLTLAGGGGRIMGLGKMEKRLYELRRKLHLENHVTMPGLINHDQLPRIIQNHDIFIAPCIIDKSGKRDGIPNTIIEAMAYAMPVIGTDINALPEIIIHKKTGIAVPQNNPQALADSIVWMKNNPEEACAMGLNGARLIKKMFHPDGNAIALSNIITNYITIHKNQR